MKIMDEPRVMAGGRFGNNTWLWKLNGTWVHFQEEKPMTEICNEELDALRDWELAIECGQNSGECGNCGKVLDDAELESGLCWKDQIEFYEAFGD